MGQVLEGQGQGRGSAERGRGCQQGGKPRLSQGKGLQDTAGKYQDKVSRHLVPPPLQHWGHSQKLPPKWGGRPAAGG